MYIEFVKRMTRWYSEEQSTPKELLRSMALNYIPELEGD